jgi:hypothetical protein
LANLHLAVVEAARAFVDVQNCTGRVQLRVDKAKTAWDRASAEQTFTGSENNRKLPNT